MDHPPPILVGIIIYFKTTVLHYVTTTCNGIVGTIISDIATMKVDLFSWMGEDLTFKDFNKLFSGFVAVVAVVAVILETIHIPKLSLYLYIYINIKIIFDF